MNIAEHLASVIEAMTGERPQVTARSADQAPETPLWWEQPLATGGTAWFGADEPAWSGIGAWVLSAAGIETHEPADARKTWLEIVSRTAAALAGDACAAGREAPPPAGAGEVVELDIAAGGSRWKAWVVRHAAASVPAVVEAPPAAKGSDLLMDVEMPVSVSFGRAQLPLKDVLKLTTGSIVELNRTINDPVEVIVNNCVIARGEVVVVEGNYGVRIQEVVSRANRLRTLR